MRFEDAVQNTAAFFWELPEMYTLDDGNMFRERMHTDRFEAAERYLETLDESIVVAIYEDMIENKPIIFNLGLYPHPYCIERVIPFLAEEIGDELEGSEVDHEVDRSVSVRMGFAV